MSGYSSGYEARLLSVLAKACVGSIPTPDVFLNIYTGIVHTLHKKTVEVLEMAYQYLKPKDDYRRDIFLICSVRNASEEHRTFQCNYTDGLEKKGHRVFWPPRDNPFESVDRIGLDIIRTNLEAILASDEVHIIFDPNSQGSIADIEAAMAVKKPIYLVNPELLKATVRKSYTNAVLNMHAMYEPSMVYSRRYGFAGV